MLVHGLLIESMEEHMPAIEGTIIQGLLNNAEAYAEDGAFSWILTGILGQGAGSTDQQQILGDLGTITADLTSLSTSFQDLQTEVGDLIKLLIASGTYTQFANPLNTGNPTLVAQVYDDYETLQSLTEVDTAEATTLTNNANIYNDALDTLSQLMSGTYPTLSGDLMTAVAAYTGTQLVAAAGYDPTDFGPLLSAYEQMKHYCHSILTLEVKALALAENAFLASGSSGEPNLSGAAATQFSSTLAAQLDNFVSAAETLATTYCPAETLIDMMGGGTSSNIILHAHHFANDYLLKSGQTTTTSRVWVWAGSGPDFSAGDASAVPGAVELFGVNNPVQPVTSVLTTFTDSNGNQWTRSRSDFPLVPENFYALPSLPEANALINSGNPSNIFLATDLPSLIVSLGGGPGADAAILMSTTSLWAGEDSQYATLSTLEANLSTYTIETWVFIGDDGFLFSTGTSPHTGSSTSSGFVVYVYQGYCYLAAIPVPNDPGNMPPNEPGWMGGGLAITTQAWHHLAVSFDSSGSGATLYVDEQSYTFPWSAGSNGLPLEYLHIGNDIGQVAQPPCPSGAAIAMFNELRVWSSVQSLSQMQANWQARITTPQPDLIGVWGFDRGNLVSRAGTGLGGWSDGMFFEVAIYQQIGWAPSAPGPAPSASRIATGARLPRSRPRKKPESTI